MSLQVLGSLGIGRDHAASGQAVPMPNQPADSAASFGQLLVAQIPSEALVGYTTLLALLAAGGSAYRTGRWILYVVAIVVCAAAVLGSYFAQRNYDLEDSPDAPAPVLSVASAPPTGSTYAEGSTAVLTLSAAPDTARAIEATTARAKSKLHPPILPVVTAMLSMAVYGLTVPGSPLQYEVSGTAFGIWSACLAVGGGVMMSLFVPFLGKGNAAKPVKEPAAN
jgi:hypothetical protein